MLVNPQPIIATVDLAVMVLAQTPVSVYLRHAVTYDGLAGTGGTAAGMTRREDAQGTATQCYCAL
eukprot:scaffold10123_cov117-Isochrysis_galbana.AAC.1